MHRRLITASLFAILAFGSVTPSYSQETCSRYGVAGYRTLPACTQNSFETTTASDERDTAEDDILSIATVYLKSFFGQTEYLKSLLG